MPQDHRQSSTRKSNQSASAMPFAMLFHGIASDPRLKGTQCVVVVSGLLYWALDSDQCIVSNEALAGYASVSVPTVKRCLALLEQLGYIRKFVVTQTPGNPTGRVLVLLWKRDPSIIPTPFPFRHEERGAVEPVAGECVAPGSPVIPPPDHQRPTPQVTSDPPPRSPVIYEEDSALRIGKKVSRRRKGTDAHTASQEAPAVIPGPADPATVERVCQVMAEVVEVNDFTRGEVARLVSSPEGRYAHEAAQATVDAIKGGKRITSLVGHLIGAARNMQKQGGARGRSKLKARPAQSSYQARRQELLDQWNAPEPQTVAPSTTPTQRIVTKAEALYQQGQEELARAKARRAEQAHDYKASEEPF